MVLGAHAWSPGRSSLQEAHQRSRIGASERPKQKHPQHLFLVKYFSMRLTTGVVYPAFIYLEFTLCATQPPPRPTTTSKKSKLIRWTGEAWDFYLPLFDFYNLMTAFDWLVANTIPEAVRQPSNCSLCGTLHSWLFLMPVIFCEQPEKHFLFLFVCQFCLQSTEDSTEGWQFQLGSSEWIITIFFAWFHFPVWGVCGGVSLPFSGLLCWHISCHVTSIWWINIKA